MFATLVPAAGLKIAMPKAPKTVTAVKATITLMMPRTASPSPRTTIGRRSKKFKGAGTGAETGFGAKKDKNQLITQGLRYD